MVSNMYYSVFSIVCITIMYYLFKKACIFGILTFNKLIVGNIR